MDKKAEILVEIMDPSFGSSIELDRGLVVARVPADQDKLLRVLSAELAAYNQAKRYENTEEGRKKAQIDGNKFMAENRDEVSKWSVEPLSEDYIKICFVFNFPADYFTTPEKYVEVID